AALLVGLVALGTAAVLLKSANDDLLAANEATEQQWQRAEDNLRLARVAEDKALQEAGKARRAQGQARTQADEAKAINAFLTRDLLGKASPKDSPHDQKVTVAQLLDRAAAKVEQNPALAGQPEVEAAIRLTIGTTYRDLGLYRQAEPHARRAVALF